MKLNEIRDKHGSRTSRKRVGRGIGSGLGKTAGAGHKGQKARRGVALKGFEGGQMPLYMRLPMRGFKNFLAVKPSIVNTGQLQQYIHAGKLAKNQHVTVADFLKVGIISKMEGGIKLLAKGEITDPLTLEVHSASKAAQEAITKAGGKISFVPSKNK